MIESAEPPPEWQRYEYALWQDERAHGPSYSCRDWFGKVVPAERMRYYRAMRALEDADLIEVARINALRSRQQVFLKVTAAGATLVAEE